MNSLKNIEQENKIEIKVNSLGFKHKFIIAFKNFGEKAERS